MLMMLPFEAPTIFEGIHKSYFKMPRVVKDQRSRFENDDLFRQLSHESAVKYTGFKDRPLEERQMKFIANCQEGHTEVSVVQSGSQFTLMFNPTIDPACNNEGCNFDRALGKVHIKAGFILNGVCVLWRGWIDLQRLEGFGCLEFDEYRAYIEDAMTKQSIQDKQQCNQASIGRPLGNGPSSLGALPPAQHSFSPATAAAAVAAITTNSMLPPLGLNPSCLGGPFGPVPGMDPNVVPPQSGPGGPPGGPPGAPPVSLADSAAHYGNAAIAAAAAAAFHQALSIGGGGPAPGGPPPHLSGLAGPPTSVAAGLAALSNGSHHPALHLPYTNGAPPPPPNQHLPLIPQGAGGGGGSPLSHLHTSPQHQFLNSNSNHNQQVSNGNSAASVQLISNMQHTNHQRSPERENQQQNQVTTNSNQSQSNRRSQAIKRAPEESTDEVDVVSDINVHDLDFPPRRIFKSEPMAQSVHHQHHHHHQKVARRAA